MLAINVAGWTVIGVLLTALFTGGTWLVAYLNHRHDRTLSGVKSKVHITAYPRSIIQPVNGLAVVPNGWDADKTRCFCMRLYNPGPVSIPAKVHVEELHMGFTRRLVRSQANYPAAPSVINLNSQVPVDVWVMVENDEGWNSDKPLRKLVWFQVFSSAKIHTVRRRVWIQPVGWEGSLRP